MGETLTTARMIEVVAQHGYTQIATLLDQNRLQEARQVAEILKEVGAV